GRTSDTQKLARTDPCAHRQDAGHGREVCVPGVVDVVVVLVSQSHVTTVAGTRVGATNGDHCTLGGRRHVEGPPELVRVQVNPLVIVPHVVVQSGRPPVSSHCHPGRYLLNG